MSRLRADRGFTLPEMLVTLSIAMIVTLATLALVEFSMRRADEVQQRVETSQRARTAMDFMTRQLRSQVCLSSDVPPMTATTNANQATFYVDLTDGSNPTLPPEKHTIVYDPATRRLIERDYVGMSSLGSPPIYTYPADSSPSRQRVLLTNAIPDRPADASADTPIFRYYAFDTATPARPNQELVPGGTGLSASDRGRVARIQITYRTLPTQATQNVRGAAVLEDDVFVRVADPNDPAPTPTCA